MAESDDDPCSAICIGSELAGELVDSLAETSLGARDKMLLWLGLLCTLQALCEQELGRETSAELFREVEAIIRIERAKAQH